MFREHVASAGDAANITIDVMVGECNVVAFTRRAVLAERASHRERLARDQWCACASLLSALAAHCGVARVWYACAGATRETTNTLLTTSVRFRAACNSNMITAQAR